MKVKKIIFTKIGERRPKYGDYYGYGGNIIFYTETNTQSTMIYNIYEREVVEGYWIPKKDDYYYMPRLNSLGEATYEVWVCTHPDQIKDPTFMFPTPELATAKMQELLDADRKEAAE